MGQDASSIRHEIEATRSRMDDTVASIAHRLDIPSRVRAGVGRRAAWMYKRMRRPLELAAAAAAIGVLSGIVIPHRGRKEKQN
jgi:Protein of unknown function (DUF3618)